MQQTPFLCFPLQNYCLKNKGCIWKYKANLQRLLGSHSFAQRSPFHAQERPARRARINKSIQTTCLILKLLRDVFNYTMCMYYSPRRHCTWISLEKCDQFNVSKCVSLSRKYIRWCYFVFFLVLITFFLNISRDINFTISFSILSQTFSDTTNLFRTNKSNCTNTLKLHYFEIFTNNKIQLNNCHKFLFSFMSSRRHQSANAQFLSHNLQWLHNNKNHT
jgi:hypothetical protein